LEGDNHRQPIKKMKNNYRKLEVQIEKVSSARADQQKVSSLRVGVIAGGPSIDDENETWLAESAALCTMAESYLENGARLSKVTTMLEDCPCFAMELILDHYASTK
jgi:hypothetical protein